MKNMYKKFKSLDRLRQITMSSLLTRNAEKTMQDKREFDGTYFVDDKNFLQKTD